MEAGRLGGGLEDGVREGGLQGGLLDDGGHREEEHGLFGVDEVSGDGGQ